MKTERIVFFAFFLVVIFQIMVPTHMIWSSEDILATGNEYKFRTRPIDPNDPYRGKYLHLYFMENKIAISQDATWQFGEPLAVLLTKDQKGFAKIKSVSREIPEDGQEYIMAKVSYVKESEPRELFVDFPFNRFYVEESVAEQAEQTYRQTSLDTTQIAYAQVSIKDGEAILKDVLIDGAPINDLISAYNAKQ